MSWAGDKECIVKRQHESYDNVGHIEPTMCEFRIGPDRNVLQFGRETVTVEMNGKQQRQAPRAQNRKEFRRAWRK